LTDKKVFILIKIGADKILNRGYISPTKLGSATVQLGELAAGGSIQAREFDVQNKVGTSILKVIVKVEWKDGAVPPYAQQAGNANQGGNMGGGLDLATLASGGGAPGGGGGAGGVPGAPTPLPNCEGQDFAVRVKIHKAKNLQSLDDDKLYDPKCIVSCMDKSKKTETCKNTLDPVFDEEVVLQFSGVKASFWSEVIVVTVSHDRLLIPNQTIGSVQIDCGTIYRSSPQHRLSRKWFVLFRSVTEGNVMGYVKLSMAVLNLRTDGALADDDDVEAEDDDRDEEMIANLVSVPGAAYEEVVLHFNIIRAEGIPKMDDGPMGKADPYVKLISGKKNTQTAHISNTFEPTWNTQVQLPLLLPALADTITLQMWDYDVASPDDIIATFRMKVGDLTQQTNRDGLPKLPPRWLNFYGPPRTYSGDVIDNKYFKAMCFGDKRGIDYRGRLLLQVQGSRSREGMTMPPVKETVMNVTVTTEILQVSMLPYSGKFKVKVMLGQKSGTTSHKETTKMIGGKCHAIYFGETVTFNTDVSIVVPDYEEVNTIGVAIDDPSSPLSVRAEVAADVAAAKTAATETMQAVQAVAQQKLQNTAAAAYVGKPAALAAAGPPLDPAIMAKVSKAIWEQMPAVVVHLVRETAAKQIAAVFTNIPRLPGLTAPTYNDEDPSAATVLHAEKLFASGSSLYICKPMRLMTDESSAKEGSTVSNPLIQLVTTVSITGLPGLQPTEPAFRAVAPMVRNTTPKSIISFEPLKTYFLECFVYRGKRFPAGDDNGLSDPFIRVNWANGAAHTGIQLETLSPVYNEAVYVQATSKPKFPDIVVELWDWDLIGSNTFLGKAVIPFAEVIDMSGPKPDDRAKTRAANEPAWFTKWTDSTGTRIEGCAVLMSFKLFGPSFEDTFKQLKKVKVPAKTGTSKTYEAVPIPKFAMLAMSQFSINLTVLGLRNMRRFRLREIQNPSLEFSIDGNLAKIEKIRGLNPNFDKEVDWTLTLPDNANYMPELEVRVYDHRVGPKQIVGTCIIDLSDPKLKITQKLLALKETDEKVAVRLDNLLDYLRHEEERLDQAEQAREAAAASSPVATLGSADGTNRAGPAASFKTMATAVRAFKSGMKKEGTPRGTPRPAGAGGSTVTIAPPRRATLGPATAASGPAPGVTTGASRTAADVDEREHTVHSPLLKGDDSAATSSAPVAPTDPNVSINTIELRTPRPADPAAPSSPTVDELPEEALREIDRAIDDVMRDVQDDMDASFASSHTEASTEPDELLWFDRYDADPSGQTAGDGEVFVPPEHKVARLGKIAKNVPGLKSGATTAEDLFGPFNDEDTSFNLVRGWGKKTEKAGTLLMNLGVQKLRPVDVEGPDSTDPDTYRIMVERQAANYRLRAANSRKSANFMARVYVIACKDLAAKDSGPAGNSSDPYVVLRLTNGSNKKDDVVVSCKDQVRYQVLNPEYFMVRELRGSLPTHCILRATVFDWDRIGRDEEIGSTEINLEDRYYSRRGYRKMPTPPAFGEGPNANNGFTYFNLNNHGCYTERRLLRNDTGLVQGSIELWVDIFDFNITVPRPIDIAPPPPIPMELRVVIWNARDVELTDTSMHGEKMTDIYIKAFVDGMVFNTQQTDVHYRSLDGSGNFNWRMIFPFVFEPRTKKIFRATPEQEEGSSADKAAKEAGGAASTAGKLKIFSVRKEQKRLDPNLHIQIWDNDLLPGADDFIGENLLNLNELRPCLTHRQQRTFAEDFREEVASCCAIMPCRLCCKCCRAAPEKSLSLEERQAIAREEQRVEREANRERVKDCVETKMAMLRQSGKFSPEALAKMERRITREARRANRVNVFKDFLPRRQKKSQRLRDDKTHDQKMRMEAKDADGDDNGQGGETDTKGGRIGGFFSRGSAQQSGDAAAHPDGGVPKVAETAKYWFACRGPNGGCRVGDVQISFQLVQLEALQKDAKLAAGKGRSEPQSLPNPDRPPSSFFWLSNPWRAAIHIFWKNYKWYILTVVCLAILAVVVYLFFSTGLEVKAKKFFGQELD
jgi:hypothetical protein